MKLKGGRRHNKMVNIYMINKLFLLMELNKTFQPRNITKAYFGWLLQKSFLQNIIINLRTKSYFYKHVSSIRIRF